MGERLHPALRPVREAMQAIANPQIAAHSARFFKTGPGEYGEGDRFWGIRVPNTRKLVVRFKGLSLELVLALLQSSYHEERLLAVLLLVRQFESGDQDSRDQIYEAYLAHTPKINNWDLVDSSAHQILGGYLLDRSREPLYLLAASDLLWERRMAVIATLAFIRRNQFEDIQNLARLLLEDSHDLIHKAVGWMLREMGKRNEITLRHFLDQYAAKMPRTMLRYAIEKLPKPDRKIYLKF